MINGEEIITTETHPFYVNDRGFVNAGELAVGDELLDSNKNILLVENFDVELTGKPVTVYNFQVEDFHTYFVGTSQIMVHNSDCPSYMNEDGGSTDLDNLVSQRSDSNRAVKNTDNYRSMEREWSKALKSGKKVTDVDVKLTYENGSSRPFAFGVSYKIIRHYTQSRRKL